MRPCGLGSLVHHDLVEGYFDTGLVQSLVDCLARLMQREGRTDVKELSCSGFGEAIIARM